MDACGDGRAARLLPVAKARTSASRTMLAPCETLFIMGSPVVEFGVGVVLDLLIAIRFNTGLDAKSKPY